MTPKLTHSFNRVKKLQTKPPKPKPTFRATGGTKFILFLGDEGLILVHARKNVVLHRHFVENNSDDSLRELREVIARDPKAKIYFVIDSMDQAYIQQALPPVSSLSINKLIKRRLQRDFGANDIKGAIFLGRDKTGRKDWNYLMVSVERSAVISSWLDFIGEQPNRFAGIHLMSVEAELIVKSLEKSLIPAKEPTGSEWKFFVSHNKVGGFRQVILRNGRLIFTRMTHPIGESTPEVISGNIEQEMLSTIEYMKRLGFTQGSGLDIYIITSNAVRNHLDIARFDARVAHVLTPFEASQNLGIVGATQPGDQFGDVVLATYIGSSGKHVLTLSDEQFKQVNNIVQIIMLQRVVAVAALIGLIGYIGQMSYDIYGLIEKNMELSAQQSKSQSEMDALRNEVKAFTPNLEKTNDTIELYKQAQEEKLSPALLLKQTLDVIKPPVFVKAVDWSLDGAAAGAAGAPKPKTPRPKRGAAAATAKDSSATDAAAAFTLSKQRMTAVFTLEFYNISKEQDALKNAADRVLTSLNEVLPGFDIAYQSLPTEGRDDKVELDIQGKEQNNRNNSADVSKPIEVKLNIKGPVITNIDREALAAAIAAAREAAAKETADGEKPAAAPAIPAGAVVAPGQPGGR